jgi:putative DNA methylase
MIPKECKRLAEVDFPIAVVSKHSAREKSIRHGHPSTLHLWWARRPLAACRAMLLGLLLPDPCDPYCPEDFKNKARELLPPVQGKVGRDDKDLQKALLKFMGDFSNWDFSSDQTYIEVGRNLVKAAHPEETPLVVDPFAGGGSIPLEALRLGCETFASDLNPVACLILKVMLEDIPRYGPQLAEELRRVGKEIKEAAEKELAEFYPSDPDGSKPIAYLWARTVRCEAPNCGAEIPLIHSFWLSTRAANRWALRPRILSKSESPPQVEFDIFKPLTNQEVANPTVSRAKATCLACQRTLAPERVRVQLSEQKGGSDPIFDNVGNRVGGARILAVVLTQTDNRGRSYRLPNENEYRVVWKAKERLKLHVADTPRQGFPLVPEDTLPLMSGTFNVPLYGISTWGDLLTSRQKLVMAPFIRILKSLDEISPEAREFTGLALSRFADIWKTWGQA